MSDVVRFVTGNAGKLREAEAALAGVAAVEQERGGYVEIQADTLMEVARAGLAEVARRVDPPFFLEDSGLFVAALSGFPGVYSAYVYKTIGCAGILRLMANVGAAERAAHFESVIAYRDVAGRDHFFTGRVAGWVRWSAAGSLGFGYDPIFTSEEGGPDGASFAELDPAAKNARSHRGGSLRALASHLGG